MIFARKTAQLRGVPATCRAAAPAGGAARLRAGRGCVLGLVLLGGAAYAGGEDALTLPSGQEVTLMEMRIEEGPDVLRLRYLAPALGSPMTRPSFDKLTEDLEYLCAEKGLPEVQAQGLTAPQIVVSFSAEAVEFGVLSPDVPQIFEAFTVQNDACMLEVF